MSRYQPDSDDFNDALESYDAINRHPNDVDFFDEYPFAGDVHCLNCGTITPDDGEFCSDKCCKAYEEAADAERAYDWNARLLSESDYDMDDP